MAVKVTRRVTREKKVPMKTVIVLFISYYHLLCLKWDHAINTAVVRDEIFIEFRKTVVVRNISESWILFKILFNLRIFLSRYSEDLPGKLELESYFYRLHTQQCKNVYFMYLLSF